MERFISSPLFFMTVLRRLTGRSFDAITVSLGYRPAYRLRYKDFELVPCPLIKKFKSQPIEQVGSSELIQESVQKWNVSLPIEWEQAFPSPQMYREALKPGAQWETTLPDTNEWIQAIVEGDFKSGNRGRVTFTLRGKGIDDLLA